MLHPNSIMGMANCEPGLCKYVPVSGLPQRRYQAHPQKLSKNCTNMSNPVGIPPPQSFLTRGKPSTIHEISVLKITFKSLLLLYAATLFSNKYYMCSYWDLTSINLRFEFFDIWYSTVYMTSLRTKAHLIHGPFS